MKFLSSTALSSLALAACLLAAPAFAEESKPPLTAWEASRTATNDDVIATGVARARDRLDSATSTSSLGDSTIAKIGATSMADLFRNIPGIRAEAGNGEVNGNYTIRGLPMVATGAKYLQIQEDGLPVLEFGDLLALIPDMFIRADFNVAQVESIRGGSASTFASNAPGGVINLISHTGEVEGGSIQASTGLDYRNHRTDFDYGGRLSDSLRFHVGGFYREGEGPRRTGFTGNRGGQFKFNVTKEFAGGFVRLEGKFLDDTTTQFFNTPLGVTGTDADPKYAVLPNFAANKDSLTSRYTSTFPKFSGDGSPSQINIHDGNHAVVKSIGFQAKFNIGDWTVSEHGRYAAQSGSVTVDYPLVVLPAQVATFAFGSPFGSLVYANGPNKGQTITLPGTLNGNGLVTYSAMYNSQVRKLDNFTNDLRVSRVWQLGTANLTSTAGVYNSRQDLAYERYLLDFIQDVVGGGNSALIDLVNADGTPNSLGGALDFTGPTTGTLHNVDLRYRVLAPYGSLNLQMGNLSLGGSLRYDSGKVEGTLRNNRPSDVRTIDANNDGVIATAETRFGFSPVTNAAPVNYSYHYTSYSVSANYRPSRSMSFFARYSRGARAAADKILFTPAISATDGGLVDRSVGYDPVKQAEVGVKFRSGPFFANLTGFSARVAETNSQIRPDANGVIGLTLVTRRYSAKGFEFEGGVRKGGFSLTAGATVTDAKIVAAEDPMLVGNTPRHQAKLIFQIMPQYETDLFTIGANAIGTTGSFSQDENKLRMPGYTTVNAFIQVRPVDRVVLSFNVNNLFDTLALTDVSAPSLPAGGVTLAQTLFDRNMTASVRFFF
ncbi:TonB-dependent receptor [Novosphingobium sp.]|uniref:TonB-dependent receptor domain-containing protein n=1 Tax=Novosphingobium sp. TaxID=1874826 RepID=UPI00261A1C17|nr:TonB-dependent receptor [Novosphingobium sp.]